MRRTDPADVRNPLVLFRQWYRQAAAAGTLLPEAMALATATPEGRPSVRMVLHRGFSRGGFAFFTNYESRKAADLIGNPHAALVFHWPLLERQVRAEGRVERLTSAESDRYFRSRPRESRLGAWASPQSSEIADRAFLEREFERTTRRFSGKSIPRPPFWGGFRLVPNALEFWQGRPFRLHDRLCYQRIGGAWRIVRLAP